MATVAKRPKKDAFGYYVDTAQGKFRIKKDTDVPVWSIRTNIGLIDVYFRTLTDAVTYIEEGWHVL